MKLPIPSAALGQHVLVLGKTRSGKSSTLRVMVETLLDDKKPVCIIDPKGDWWGIKSSADGKKAGYDVVIFGGTHADVPINAHSGKVVAELVATGNRPCLIDLGGWMVGERTRFFIDFASTLFTRTHGHRWLVIDECHNFAPQGKVQDPQAGMSLHWANRLASEGAGKGIVLLSASQRPQKVHKDYVTSHETLIAKRVVHPLDRGAMKDWIDGCGDPKKGAEVLDTLAGLQRSEGWVWSPEIDFGPKLVQFPMFATYDSFAVQTGKAGRRLKGWASVDLEEVKAKLATVVAEADANDPKKLRAEIAALRAERDKLAKAAPAAADPASIEKARQDADAAGFKRGKIEGYGEGVTAMRNEVQEIAAAFSPFEEAMKGFGSTLHKCEQWAKRAVKHPPKVTIPQGSPTAAKPLNAVSLAPVRRVAVASGARPSSEASGDGTYSNPQMKVLRSLAMWRALGHDTPTRQMVAAVAGYRPGTGRYGDIVGSLVSVGAIGKPDVGRLSLAAADINTPSVDEGRALLLASLDNPQKKLIAPMVDAGEKTREQLAAESGYQAGTGRFGDLVGSLVSIGILVKPGVGRVALSDWAQQLFTGHADRIAA